MSAKLIEGKDIFKTYYVDSVETTVLKGVDVAIAPKGLVAIVGPSGAGKSTLVHVLSSLDPPTAGRVFFEGEDLYARNDKALARFRNETIGFVFQFHHLMPEFTALENAMMPLLIRGEGRSAARKKVLELLGSLGLKERADHRPTELSGGEQQRVAVARALITSPRILFADEPTGNLDVKNGEKLIELFLKLHREREMALVLVTHNPAIAAQFPVKIRMENGRIAS